MKKAKIKERFENAVNAFFDDEKLCENKLSFANDSALSEKKTFANLTGTADAFLNIVKQVFLFFPGTLVLFNLTLVFTALSLNPPGGTTLLYPERLALLLVVSAFMTVFGLGDIKKIKHLIVPASIFLFALISGFVISLSTNALKIIEVYAMYLTPLALIIPILAKGWIDRVGGDAD